VSIAGSSHYPQIYSWPISVIPGYEDNTGVPPEQIAIVRRRQVNLDGEVLHDLVIGPIIGLLENDSRSEESFTLEVVDSDDNAPASYGAALTLRVDGANVTSVEVVPGGKAVFAIEGSTKAFLKFKTTADGRFSGRMTLTHFGGILTRIEHEAELL
jgi:hypothetical protein